ncbi:MAG: 5'-methylthioadenosine/S-adenosylhomocysteine nucleosidase [Micavibrio sp.]|nr:5'-methylthioadenosine/S-adenosylhomocysteine nucleosidase [Micavibrio sp.]
MKPLLVFAMEQEAADMFGGCDVLHTGIGKVNASYALMKRLAAERPEIVINLGTAGSRKFAGGTLVNPTRFIQRDMDVRALGFELGQTPFSNDPVVVEYGTRIDALPDGLCGTGDNFDTSEEAGAYDVVDMEAFALALICAREKIPFLCLKYISDGADDDAHNDFNTALLKAAKALHTALGEHGYGS